MKKKIITILLFIIFQNLVLAGEYYTVQIKAVPAEKRSEADSIADNLRNNFRFVYLDQTISNKTYIRIRHGVFQSYSQAKERAEFLKKNFNHEYFIDKLSTPIVEIVKQEPNISKAILETFIAKEKLYSDKFNSSPDSSSFIMHDKYSFYVLNLIEQSLSLIGQKNDLDGFNTTSPKWSFDSQFVGYFDFINSDVLTNLFVANKDGSNIIKIDPSPNNQENVWKYCWHPNQHSLIYIYGYCWGSATTGGDLCYIDLNGNKKILIKSSPEKKQVSKRKLFIKNDKIYFDFVEYNEQSGHSYWPDSLNLAVVLKQ
jgi:hypothetical protein